MTMQEFQVFEALSFAFLQPPDIPVAGLYAIIKTVYFRLPVCRNLQMHESFWDV